MKNNYLVAMLVIALFLKAAFVVGQPPTNLVISGPSTFTPGSTNTIIKVNFQPVDTDGKTLTGTDNIFLGYSAGGAYYLSTSRSTIVGSQAGAYTGRHSTAVTTDNTLIGANAGSFLIGSYNTFTGSGVGAQSVNQGATSVGGAYNTFTGYLSGYSLRGGNKNTFMGSYSGFAITQGSSNIAVGIGTLAQNQIGNKNVAIGDSAGYNTTVSGNLLVGSKAGYLNQTGTQNTFVGYEAGFSTVSTANTFLGYRAGANTTTGQFNSFIGVQAGQSNTTGSSNYFFGTNSGAANVSGSGNYFLGDNAGGGNSSGGFNIYIGANAGNGPGVNGDNNLAVGFESGKSNQSGVNNTFIGFRADAGAGSLNNATAIGNNAKVNISNALVLGNGANVGIGTSSPASKLHIVTGTANTSGIRLGNLTSGSPASVTNQYKFLTVDGSGNVVLGSLNGSARQGVGEALWQHSEHGVQTTSDDAVIIGSGVSKTPSDYSLFVSKGILTEKVKVAVKNTADWSDKVFERGYTLRSLGDVEQYIRKNSHLPGVPSAAEVVERGLDVAKMDAKLLEKIEELTLYSIQLEKVHRQQQAEIDELKQLVKQLINKK
ncbi:MAG TPA: hypothetical protein VGB67_11600 [Fibrella sp.]